MRLSIVIPAKDEVNSIASVVSSVLRLYPGAEVIVVDDGSSDQTASAAEGAGAIVVSHPYSKGNGAAIKTGVRSAVGDIVVCMDGDGQHDPCDIALLHKKMLEGYDMVVGARNNKSQAGMGRLIGNKLYNKISSWMVGHQILDLTSGFRLARADKFKEFLYLLPNGFSYPTTITMAFFRAGYAVAYVPIEASKRVGKSHINLVGDGMRFFLIIFKVGTLYSPLKIFFPVSILLSLSGVSLYLYNYMLHTRLTNMSVILLLGAIIVFLIGLVSEQITTLMYAKQND